MGGGGVETQPDFIQQLLKEMEASQWGPAHHKLEGYSYSTPVLREVAEKQMWGRLHSFSQERFGTNNFLAL